MASETTAIERFIINRLIDDGELSVEPVAARVYNESAPAGAGVGSDGKPRQIILVRYISGRDVGGIGSIRQAVPTRYIVEGVLQAQSFARIGITADAIDRVLHKAHDTVVWEGNTYKVSIKRLAPFKLQQFRDGVYTSRLGGEYEVTVTLAS